MKSIKVHKNKLRTLLVILFILIYAIITYISLRSQYLEYAELGEQYIYVFLKNIKYKYLIMGISFILLSLIISLTNIGIKKGLTPFFKQEEKQIPKLPNKSITLIASAVISVIISNDLLEKILLFVSNVSFEKTEMVLNLDISYYMFIKPLIEIIIKYYLLLIIGLSIYILGYYILVFNLYFDAIDRELLRKSKLIKTLLRNAFLLAIGMALLTILNTQNAVLGNFLTLNNGVELTGAGTIEATISLWGYVILAILIVLVSIIAIKQFNQNKNKKMIYTVLAIPTYLVGLYIVIIGYDIIFVKPNEFDKERTYIKENIKSTKEAYNINVDELNVQYSGTITQEVIQSNSDIIENISILSKNMVLKSLKDTQTEAGYYTYRNATLQKYKINGKDQLVYVSPREIESDTTSYNNKTYEYTHGIGQVVSSATKVTEDGNVDFIQNDIDGKDNIYPISEPRIYYGLETNSTAVINTKNKTEYDYTDNNGIEHLYCYTGNSGIQVGFIDRLILSITSGDIKLAMSNTVTNNSKILINRNIRERAKTALPYLIYDENPYTIVSDGQIYWVLDGYTVSNRYPYSTFSEIYYEGELKEINYIRNSVKVLVNAYNGEMTFYITDRTDPIIMAYLKLYPTLFSDYTGKEMQQEIKEQLIYPEFLYKVQSKMLMIYHNDKEDVLYRNNDIWSLVKYNTESNAKNKTTELEPQYAIIKTPNDEQNYYGLIQMYTPEGKSNIISYLLGTCNNGNNELKIYKYPSDSNIIGPIQLDNQIQQDETISTEIDEINVTGTKLTKEMKIIPIENTLLYVETLYQTMTNEPNTPTTLKKVIVASGSKVAIGNSLEEALSKIWSQSAVNIEINNTENLEGLVKAIIDANNNLTESNNRNDWEMIGSDLKKLQELIKSLEKMMENETNIQKNTETEKNKINIETVIENVIN